MKQLQRRLSIINSHIHPVHSSPVLSRDKPSGSVEPSSVSNNDDCIFCLIVRGESPAFKLYEDDVCECILDSNPLTQGHSLIITKSHYPSLDTTPPHVIAAMTSKVPFLSSAIKKATQSDSFNLLVNSGSAAGQVIFHTHLHLIPRKAGDELWSSENSRRQPIKHNEETEGLLDSIKQMLSSSDNGRLDCEPALSKN